jgi:predicted nucleic acid-binding protein
MPPPRHGWHKMPNPYSPPTTSLTLLRARGQKSRAIALGSAIVAGSAATLHFISPKEFHDAWEVFRRFGDKQWSFTDCTSKVVIENFSLTTAFSFDHHFRQFGTVRVVP